MQISVVIATYNRREKLRNCLTAVCQQTHSPYEVIVVDDASTDNTKGMIQKEFPEIRYFCMNKNRGPAAARNRGIQEARGEFIAFTDDDCLVPPQWLEQLANGFTRYPHVAGVGGYQEAPDSLLKTNVVARAEHVMRLKRWGEKAFREQVGGYEVPGLGTNNVAFRRDVLLAVDGFDQLFPVAAGEDADLKLRIAQREYQLLYLPLKVEHHRSYTLRHQWKSWIRRGIGAYYFEAKHSHAPGLIRILLRFAKRVLLFFPDMARYGWKVSAVILLTRIADAYGQFIMAYRTKKEGVTV